MRLSLSLFGVLCAVGCGALGSASSPRAGSEQPQGDAAAERAPSHGDEDAGSAPSAPGDGVSSDTSASADAAPPEGDDGDLEEDEAASEDGEHGPGRHGDEDGAYAEKDGVELAPSAKLTATATRAKARPIDDLSRTELQKLLKSSPESLGPLSVGLPNSGRLFNAVELPESKYFHRVSPDKAYGTEETVDALIRAAARVHEQYPDSPPLFVGHLSRPSGGYLSPHLSHQAGRDVDLGFYYSDKPRWYTRATAANLDVPRTWALVRALIVETDVEMILIDHGIIALLKSHALARGEDPIWLDRVFSGKEGGRTIIRHARGHATHLHIRFFNPDAQRRGQKLYPLLVEQNLVPPVTVYSTFRAKKGDTLGKIAKRYNTTVEALKRANGLKKSLIVAGRVYKIAQRGGPKPNTAPLTFPPRQLPSREPPPVRIKSAPSAAPGTSTAARAKGAPPTKTTGSGPAPAAKSTAPAAKSPTTKTPAAKSPAAKSTTHR